LNLGHKLERPAWGDTPKISALSSDNLNEVRITQEGVRDSKEIEIPASYLLKFELALREKGISHNTIKQY
jgi:hypothetical protein